MTHWFFALSLALPLMAQEESSSDCPFSEVCCRGKRALVSLQKEQRALGTPSLGDLEREHDVLMGERIILEGLEALDAQTETAKARASTEIMLLMDRTLETLRDNENTDTLADFFRSQNPLDILKDEVTCNLSSEDTLCTLLADEEKGPHLNTLLLGFTRHYRATLSPGGESHSTFKVRMGRYRDALNPQEEPAPPADASTPGKSLAELLEEIGRVEGQMDALKDSDKYKELQREIEQLTGSIQVSCGMNHQDSSGIPPCRPRDLGLPRVPDLAQGPISVAIDSDPLSPSPPPVLPSPPAPPPPPPEDVPEEEEEMRGEAQRREEELAWARSRRERWKKGYVAGGELVGRRPSTASLLGYAVKDSAPNIMGAVMSMIVRPNYDSLYQQAIYSKNTEYLYELLEKKQAEFYKSPDAFPCAPLFCGSASPYINPLL